MITASTPRASSSRRAGAMQGSLAFGWRALCKLRHVPEQLTEAVAIPLVFTVLFTYLFGGALADSTREYLEFILPGTLVMAVLLVTMYVGTSLHLDVAKGVHDRYRSLPIWRPSPLVGVLLGEAVRYLIAGLLVVVLGVAMGFRPDGGVVGAAAALGLVVVFALGLAWVWVVLALVVRTPNALFGIATVVLFPLTLASNVFVDPDTMPGWVQAFVEANPVSHLVTASRDLMAGTATAAPVIAMLGASVAVAAVFAPLALRLYDTRR